MPWRSRCRAAPGQWRGASIFRHGGIVVYLFLFRLKCSAVGRVVHFSTWGVESALAAWLTVGNVSIKVVSYRGLKNGLKWKKRLQQQPFTTVLTAACRTQITGVFGGPTWKKFYQRDWCYNIMQLHLSADFDQRFKHFNQRWSSHEVHPSVVACFGISYKFPYATVGGLDNASAE